MTKSKFFFLLALTALVLLGSLPMSAQTAAARVKVPFAFEAANTVLPAGTYTLERSAHGMVLSISNQDGTRRFIATDSTGSSSLYNESHLLFERGANGTYQLASLRLPGDGATTIVHKSSKTPVMVGQNQEPERILLAINIQ